MIKNTKRNAKVCPECGEVSIKSKDLMCKNCLKEQKALSKLKK